MNDFSLIWFSSQSLIWSCDKWCENLKCYSKLLPLYTETRHMGHSSKIKISSKSLCISLYFCMEWQVTNNNTESLGMAHISIETHNMYHQLSVILWYIHWIIVCPQRKFLEETVSYFYTIALYHCFAIQYIPRNMHTVFALLCFVVVIHWLIFPYPSGLLHWHCGNLTIAPVPAKQPWWIWINTSCEFIMNDCITTTKQSTTKPCAYFLGYTVAGIILDQYFHQFLYHLYMVFIVVEWFLCLLK